MKPQLKTLNWLDFDQHNPCYSPQEKYGDFSGTILDLLKDERIPNEDKILAFTRKGVMDDKTLRLFAVRCARQVQHLMKDQRSINALDVAEKYANGLATYEELAAAGVAWDAERYAERVADAAGVTAGVSAMVAAGEAWAEAGEAATAAAREKQVQIAIDLINEFYEEPKPRNKFIKPHGLIEKLITFVKSINLLKLWQTK